MGEAGVYVAVSVQGDSIAGIAGQMPQLQGHPAFWGVYLAVDDVDATAAKVVPAGGKVEAGPFDVMELGRMASHPGPHRRPREPLAGRPEHRLGAGQRARLPDLARAQQPGPARRHEVLQRRARRRVGGDADGDRRRLHLPHGRGPAGRRRLPAADGRLPPHWDVYFNVEDCDATRPGPLELGGERSWCAPYDVPGRRPDRDGPRPAGRALLGLLQNPPKRAR